MPFMDEGRVKKKDLGVTGLIIVFFELASSFQSNRWMGKELVKVQSELYELRTAREQYVKRSDVVLLVKKLDGITRQVNKVSTQVATISEFLEDELGYDYAFAENTTQGCEKRKT